APAIKLQLQGFRPTYTSINWNPLPAPRPDFARICPPPGVAYGPAVDSDGSLREGGHLPPLAPIGPSFKPRPRLSPLAERQRRHPGRRPDLPGNSRAVSAPPLAPIGPSFKPRPRPNPLAERQPRHPGRR